MQNALHEDSITIFAEKDDVACGLHASQPEMIFVNEAAESGSIGEQCADSAKFADVLQRLL